MANTNFIAMAIFITANDVLEKNPINDLTEKEQKLKDKFQQIIDEKEKDISFELNNNEFKLK